MSLLIMLAQLAATPTPRAIAVAPAETLAVTVSGSGVPVVLLPGLFGAAYGYRRVTPELEATGFQVIIVEPLGVGFSSRPRGADYSLTAQARRVGAVLDTLSVRGAVLVAHSIAGSIALRLAVERPELVCGVVSLEGGPAEQAASRGLRTAMTFAPLLRLFGGRGAVRGKLHTGLREDSADPSWVTDAVVDGYTAGATRDLGATFDVLRGVARAREPWALRPRLGEITVPVVLLLGATRHQSGPPQAEVETMRMSLRRFMVRSVEGSGHFLAEERPDAVTGAVQETLAAVVLASLGTGRPSP